MRGSGRAVRAQRDALLGAAEHAASRAAAHWPAVVVAAPAGTSPVTVDWNGTQIQVPYADHLTDLQPGHVVVLVIAATSTPYVSCRLTGTVT